MARENRYKTLIYKHVDFHKRGATLQAALDTSLKKLKTIGKRRQSLSPDTETPIYRVVGQFRAEDSFLFGVMVQFTPGTNPTFLVDDEHATTMTVEQMAAPKTTDGKNREPMEGMLFFAASGNHLVMMQGAALRSMHLEQHLQWLAQHGGGIESDNTFKLMNQPPKKILSKIENHPVRSLEIGGELLPGPREDEDEGEDVAAAASARGSKAKALVVSGDTASGGIMEALKGFLSKSQLAKLNVEAMSASNIEYVLQIRYRQATNESGHKFMDQLGAALRHADDVETKIKLVGGGEIRGDDLKLSSLVRIEHINGVPNPDHVFEEMRTWLLARLKSGDVKA